MHVDDQRLMPLSKLDEGDHPIAIELQGLHTAIEKLQVIPFSPKCADNHRLTPDHACPTVPIVA
jgi:hypothetical protein